MRRSYPLPGSKSYYGFENRNYNSPKLILSKQNNLSDVSALKKMFEFTWDFSVGLDSLPIDGNEMEFNYFISMESLPKNNL